MSFILNKILRKREKTLLNMLQSKRIAYKGKRKQSGFILTEESKNKLDKLVEITKMNRSDVVELLIMSC